MYLAIIMVCTAVTSICICVYVCICMYAYMYVYEQRFLNCIVLSGPNSLLDVFGSAWKCYYLYGIALQRYFNTILF